MKSYKILWVTSLGLGSASPSAQALDEAPAMPTQIVEAAPKSHGPILPRDHWAYSAWDVLQQAQDFHISTYPLPAPSGWTRREFAVAFARFMERGPVFNQNSEVRFGGKNVEPQEFQDIIGALRREFQDELAVMGVLYTSEHPRTPTDRVVPPPRLSPVVPSDHWAYPAFYQLQRMGSLGVSLSEVRGGLTRRECALIIIQLVRKVKAEPHGSSLIPQKYQQNQNAERNELISNLKREFASEIVAFDKTLIDDPASRIFGLGN